MSTLEQRITETLDAHEIDPSNLVNSIVGCTCRDWAVDLPGGIGRHDAHRAHVSEAIAAALAPVLREAQAEALEAEARNLRELRTLIEETPWNPMPADDKARCLNFVDESGLPLYEYAERRFANYAAWLEHRSARTRVAGEVPV